VIDPNKPDVYAPHNVEFVVEKASVGVPVVVESLLNA
jgi:hypothetical protein